MALFSVYGRDWRKGPKDSGTALFLKVPFLIPLVDKVPHGLGGRVVETLRPQQVRMVILTQALRPSVTRPWVREEAGWVVWPKKRDLPMNTSYDSTNGPQDLLARQIDLKSPFISYGPKATQVEGPDYPLQSGHPASEPWLPVDTTGAPHPTAPLLKT